MPVPVRPAQSRIRGKGFQNSMSSREDALIGYTGFVGSNLDRQHQFQARFNSKNIGEIEGRRFNNLVFAGAQAKKWWANAHPDEDWVQIERALSSLNTVRVDHVVLISTIDVVPKASGIDEDVDCSDTKTDSYGRNRLRLERSFEELFENITIIRLPGLFGRGLKKNVIYDLLNDHQIDKINPESIFQYYGLDHVWQDIIKVRRAGITSVA